MNYDHNKIFTKIIKLNEVHFLQNRLCIVFIAVSEIFTHPKNVNSYWAAKRGNLTNFNIK